MMILVLLFIAAALLAVAWFSRHERLQRAAVPVAVLSAAQTALAERLQGDITMLGQSIGERNLWHYAALATAADYIEAQFRATGLRVERQGYLVAQRRVENLVAEVAGTENPEQTLLVGAHYDSVRSSPGVNDNGSGVAALLELARQLANARPKYSLRLVAIVNEEPPFFKSVAMGSRTPLVRWHRITASLLSGFIEPRQQSSISRCALRQLLGWYDLSRHGHPQNHFSASGLRGLPCERFDSGRCCTPSAEKPG